MVEFSESNWPEALFRSLVNDDIRFFPYVPDAGNARLITLAEADPRTRVILLTTEEEGIAFCAGADLVSQRAVMVMQSSGVGNCVNFLGLSRGANFPLFMIITMRGDFGEGNPWQYPMGRAVRAVLDSMGVHAYNVNSAMDLEKATPAAISAVYQAGQSAALVLTQRFLGAKTL